MFGFKSNGANVYAQMGIETGVAAASPNKLIIMLYEGAITACHSAITHMQNKDIMRKGEMVTKATLIIESGLRLSLNKQAGGEIAQSLDALYLYMTQRLTLANIRNDANIVNEVIQLLGELKSAWEAIEKHGANAAEISNVVALRPQVGKAGAIMGLTRTTASV